MGNKIGRWRSSVDEKFTKPQGLYDHGNVDHKRLRKLILDAKLAPCYPGGEERSPDLEECPICFLNYPSLNRSTCCAKGICTECFLQMQPPYSNRPMCPFCKTLFYAVDYRGAMTKEEKGMEQLEEQRIIEAQIRMRQQELNDEKQESQKRQGSNSSVPSSRLQEQPDSRCNLLPDPLPAPASRLSSHSRENNVDVDLEDIMIMEAIWLSIQEQGDQSYPTCGHSLPGVHSDTMSLVSRGTPSAGLACAVAALAEDQYSIRPPALNTSQQLDRICVPASSSGRCINGTSERRTTRMEEGDIQALDHDSLVIAEAGTSYSSANVKVEGVNMASNHFLPVNFEEQMMLAMAMSIADTEHGQITKD